METKRVVIAQDATGDPNHPGTPSPACPVRGHRNAHVIELKFTLTSL